MLLAYNDPGGLPDGFLSLFWSLLGFFLIFGLVLFIAYAIVVALCVLGQWKVLKKAGRPGWAALIPIYNVYEMGKVAFPRKADAVITTVLAGAYLVANVIMRIVTGSSSIDLISSYSYWALSNSELVGEVFSLGIGAALIVFLIRMYVSLARSFGQSGWHALGFLLAPPVWWLLFGLERSFVYQGQGGTGHPAYYDGPATYGGAACSQQTCPYTQQFGQAQPQQSGMAGQPQGTQPDVTGQPPLYPPQPPAPTSPSGE